MKISEKMIEAYCCVCNNVKYEQSGKYFLKDELDVLVNECRDIWM